MSEPQTMVEPEQAVQPEKKKSKNVSRWIGAAVLLAIVGYGIKSAVFASGHEVTDNAAVSGDVVQVSPQVAGTVKDIKFEDNQEVKAGDVLFVLDDSKYIATLAQAKANLDSAIAEAKAAGIDVVLTANLGSADVLQANGGVQQSNSAVGSAQATVDQYSAQLQSAQASSRVAESDLQDAEIGEKAAQLNLEKAQSDLAGAKASVSGASAQVELAKSSVTWGVAREAETAKEASRARSLLGAGAISQQDLDRAELAHSQAVADLESARQSLALAQSALLQRQSAVDAALKAVQLAQSGIQQSKNRTLGTQGRLQASKSSAAAAKSLVDSARKNVAVASGKAVQAMGQEKTALTAPQKVELKQAARELALAKVEQAKAAVQSAELDVRHTRIVAPTSGRVSKRTAQIGLLAQVGSPLVSIVPKDSLYVLANFKETQTAKLHIGEDVEVEVDGIPGTKFHGKIDSLSAATGSTFALLPPDNATGNFVKVVQRLPVKIVFDDESRHDKRLSVGMSVTVTVVTK